MSYEELLENLEHDLEEFEITHKDLIRAFVKGAYSKGVIAGQEEIREIYTKYEK